MIDLTPLDVRKKRGDFAKALRGYDIQEVDIFLELVAERMEVLVKENLQLRERSERLGEQVSAQEGREKAVQEALVTAQELRQDVKQQAHKEAELLEREARGRVDGMMAEAEKLLEGRQEALQELERQRHRFLQSFRALLQREMDVVEVEAGRAPLEDLALDLDLGRRGWTTSDPDDADERDEDESEPSDSGEPNEADAAEIDEDLGEDDDLEDGDHGDEVGLEDAGADLAEEGEGEKKKKDSDARHGDSLWLSSILERDDDEEEED